MMAASLPARVALALAGALALTACQPESTPASLAADAQVPAAPTAAPTAGPTAAPTAAPSNGEPRDAATDPTEPSADAALPTPDAAPIEPPVGGAPTPPVEPSEAPPTEPPAPAPDPHAGMAVGWRPLGDAGVAPPNRPEPEPPAEPAVDPFEPAPTPPHDAPAPLPTRPRRRMDVDQLDRAISAVMGGLGWTEVRNGVEVNLFVDLAATLGKPDYVMTTYESLEPTPTFQKFLSDAARSVCERRVQADLALPEAERVVLRWAGPGRASDADVVANLSALLLRAHGRRLEAHSAGMRPWRWLYDSSLHVTRDPVVAWKTVCVGLISHPDFYTY